MIKLQIEDYCNECPHFEADVEGPTRFYTSQETFYVGDTIVTCTHKHICANLHKVLTEGTKETND